MVRRLSTRQAAGKRFGARRLARRRRRAIGAGSARRGAENRLRNFRQSTLVAVAITGLLLLIFSPDEASVAQDAVPGASADSAVAVPDTVAVIQQVPTEELRPGDTTEVEASAEKDPAVAAEEATGALRELWNGFVGNLPKYLIAVGILLLAWLLVRLVRGVLRALLGRWERANAIAALTGVAIWLISAGVALSVLLGDIRALAGSLGLVGLALSWALQTPIESFTGWLLNSFKGYYRVGDRISVGDVFGDVYRIDFLNTTVWEYGGADRPPGSVQAEQPTGRLITFPNNEIVTGTVVNYTRDFAYVWDELGVAVAAESDLPYAMEVLRAEAVALLGDYMREPARRYRALLAREGLESQVAEEPQVFLTLTDWSANVTLRYLVGAREKRKWKSDLALRVTVAMARPEHAGRILPVYPRQQIQLIDAGGAPVAPPASNQE